MKKLVKLLEGVQKIAGKIQYWSEYLGRVGSWVGDIPIPKSGRDVDSGGESSQ